MVLLKLNKRHRNGSDSNENAVKKGEEEELDFEGDEDIKDSSQIIPKKLRERKESVDSGSIKEDGERKSDKDEPESGEELEDGEVNEFCFLPISCSRFQILNI